MRAPASLEFTITLDATWKMVQRIYQLAARVINGNISFGDGVSPDNISGVWAAVVTPVAPNTDFVITHNLGRLPVGYLVMEKDAACDVYDGTIAADITTITLKATGIGTALRIFIL